MSQASTFCGACGVNALPTSHFCESCGAKVNVTARQAAPAFAAASAAAPSSAALSSTPAAAVRGAILRDTNAGPGLLAVHGVQLPFMLEQHWRGTAAPQVNGAVDVVLDGAGQVASVTPAATLISAQQLTELAALKDAYLPKLIEQVQRIGKPLLIAVGVLALSWIWLPAVSVRINPAMTQSLTMFDLLRLANASNGLEGLGQQGGSSGLLGLLCVLAMFAPLAHVFTSHKWARYGMFAPLGFIVLSALLFYFKVHNATNASSDALRSFAGKQMAEMADAMISQMMAALSVGFGTDTAIAAALYLAWLGSRMLLSKRS